MEVNHILKGKKIPLWTNPTVGARLGEKVTFHVIGLGTAFHTFLRRGTAGWSPAPPSTPPTSAPSAASFVVEAGEGVRPGEWHY